MPTVRQIADNEWVLLLSRAAAALAVPGVIGAFLFAWNMNAQQAVVTDNLARHETQINANTMALTRAATRDDIARMEARIISQIESLREDQRADRNRPQ